MDGVSPLYSLHMASRLLPICRRESWGRRGSARRPNAKPRRTICIVTARFRPEANRFKGRPEEFPDLGSTLHVITNRVNSGRPASPALIENHIEDDGRDREERERRHDIQNRDQDPPATFLVRHAAPELVELVGLGHVPSLPRFYFGLPSACASSRRTASALVGKSDS